jgi:hypothetical protein
MKSATPSISSGVSGTNEGQPQIQPQEVWPQMTPTQQQIVFQTLVMICRHFLQAVSQTSPPEVPDE